MQKYKIRGADDKEYGPVTAEVLRQWIAEKRAVATTLVQAEESTEWKPLASYPEFADALGATAPMSGIPPLPGSRPPNISPTPQPVGPTKTSGLAIASLICGLLGFLCLPAVAGLITGIMALVKISKSRGELRGNGLAIAGLCISGVMLLVAVPAGLLLPALAKAKDKATRINCVSNMKQIGLGARMYSMDNNEKFPLNFQSMSNELSSPKVLWCPADTRHSRAQMWEEYDPERHLSYEYLKPGIAESNALYEVIFRCPIHNNVGMGDGSVQMRRER